MSTNLVILGKPPDRALFNVKSKTLRVLTTTFLLMKTQCCHHGNSSHCFYRARCEDIHKFQDITYLPHTWSLQNFKCMEFKSPSVVVLHQDISRCFRQCSSHVRRCCLSVILLDLPLERLATKITRRKTIS